MRPPRQKNLESLLGIRFLATVYATGMLTWLDRLPWIWLLLLAAWMAVAPITPEPHLVEKLRLLVQGELVRPLDIFDLAMHASPLLVVALKLWRQWHASRPGRDGTRPEP